MKDQQGLPDGGGDHQMKNARQLQHTSLFFLPWPLLSCLMTGRVTLTAVLHIAKLYLFQDKKNPENCNHLSFIRVL